MNRRALNLALILAATTGCDALVGGMCLPGYAEDGERCIPISDASSDGAGGNGFQPSTSGSAGQNAGGSSIGECDPPLAYCAEGCVDLQTDFNNCGACGVHCPTEICEDGVCQGEPVGHLVTIGMSYQESHGSSRRVLGNAVFRTLHEPTRILELRQHALPATVAQIHTILDSEAQQRNRTYEIDSATYRQIPDLVFGYDILLVHDLAMAPPGKLASIGAELEPTVAAFAAAGGTIVVTASASGTGEMCDFLSVTDILACTGFGSAMGGLVHNKLPNDVVGNGVVGPFVAKPLTSTLITEEGGVVFASDDGAPIVVHKVTY